MDIEIGASKLIINKAELEVELNGSAGQVGRWLQQRGTAMTLAAKRQVGVDTGALKASIHMRVSRDAVGQLLTVSASGPYALAHHEGTKPHVITPNNANILRFSAGGRMIYTHEVNHPGTRANRFLTDQLWMVKV
jgi:hypothetical protein